MSKIPAPKNRKAQEMASEYRFDYKKAKPNRFAQKMKNAPVIVLIAEDVLGFSKTAPKKGKR